jgi:hypothetical protein
MRSLVAGWEVFANGTDRNFLVAGRPVAGVGKVSRPAIMVYSPEGKNTGAAVVAFPGGGYWALAIDLEGTEVCDWLMSKGITRVLSKYRVPGEGLFPRSGPYPKSPMSLEHAQRTVGLVRCHARGGISIRTRSECLGFRRAGIWRQRSARILRSACTQL